MSVSFWTGFTTMAQTDETFVLFCSYLVRKYLQLLSEVKIIALTAILLVESLDNCYIHTGNVLFRVPEIEHSSSQRFIEEFGTPLRGEVSRKDGAPLEKGLPEYLVEPFEYRAKHSKFLDDVKLVDFSESFFISTPPKLINTPTSLHPPELVFQHVLTEAVDIWNLGCTVRRSTLSPILTLNLLPVKTYELVIGRTPFEAYFGQYDKVLVPQFQKVIGGVPDKWVEDALTSGILNEKIDDSSAKAFLPLEQRIRESYFASYRSGPFQLGDGELELLGRYLRKMLIVDPKQRAKSGDLLAEAWISESN
ncbi:MAG: hypothetical protein Q9172_007050 [Xanthocarpia lactea]